MTHHHHSGAPHPPAAAARSLLRLSAIQRLALASLLIGLIWIAYVWATR